MIICILRVCVSFEVGSLFHTNYKANNSHKLKRAYIVFVEGSRVMKIKSVMCEGRESYNLEKKCPFLETS